MQETLEVKIKSGDRAIYKDKTSLNDQKRINRIFRVLKDKFGIFLRKEDTERKWFDD